MKLHLINTKFEKSKIIIHDNIEFIVTNYKGN